MSLSGLSVVRLKDDLVDMVIMQCDGFISTIYMYIMCLKDITYNVNGACDADPCVRNLGSCGSLIFSLGLASHATLTLYMSFRHQSSRNHYIIEITTD